MNTHFYLIYCFFDDLLISKECFCFVSLSCPSTRNNCKQIHSFATKPHSTKLWTLFALDAQHQCIGPPPRPPRTTKSRHELPGACSRVVTFVWHLQDSPKFTFCTMEGDGIQEPHKVFLECQPAWSFSRTCLPGVPKPLPPALPPSRFDEGLWTNPNCKIPTSSTAYIVSGPTSADALHSSHPSNNMPVCLEL